MTRRPEARPDTLAAHAPMPESATGCRGSRAASDRAAGPRARGLAGSRRFVRTAAWAAAVALALAACGAAGTGPTPPAPPAPPGGNGPGNGDGTPAPAVHDTIAYVRSGGDGRDEIRLVAPDGSDDRLLWRSAGAQVPTPSSVTSLAWRPDGRALAFTSDHERTCSWYHADVYTVRSDGAGLRRVTNAPDCAGLADLPLGSVTVGLQNHTFSSGLFQVYVQGALGMQQITLGAGSSGTVTFPQVADLGAGVQPAAAILGGYRWIGGAAADVQPGATVHAGTISITGEGVWRMGADGVTWRADGDRLAYLFGECAAAFALPASPGLGVVGDELLGVAPGTVQPCRMAWGPTEATAHQVLYTTMGVFDDGGVWLTSEGGGAGSRVVELMGLGYGEFVHDVAWLPDGSGFVFTGFLFPEDDPFDYDYAGNVYRYDLASGGLSRITSFATEFARGLAVAPDGVHVVFELEDEIATELPPELWIVRLDGTGLRRLVDEGRAPAWSR